MMCQACDQGQHHLCGMQTWCECECDGPDGIYLDNDTYPPGCWSCGKDPCQCDDEFTASYGGKWQDDDEDPDTCPGCARPLPPAGTARCPDCGEPLTRQARLREAVGEEKTE